MRPASPSPVRTLALAVALVLGLAAVGRAQPAPGAARAARPAAPQPAVVFSDDVLEITPARLAALLAGLDAEEAARPGVERDHEAALARYREADAAFPARLAQYERDVAAWQGDVERHRACAARIEERTTNGADAQADRATAMRSAAAFEEPGNRAALETRLRDLAARMQAAQQRGDQRAMMALSDSLRRATAPAAAAGQQGAAIAQRGQARVEAAVEEIRRTCGPNPEARRPRSPDSPNSLLPDGAGARLTDAGARAARLTPRQYAVLKERVGAYLALTRNGPGIAAQYAFAPGERAALDGAMPGLIGHQTQLADW